MKLSTRGRYGLRAMFELARGFGKGPVLMSTVADRQDLSRKHLHNLLTILKSAGLVRSVLGPGGGFALTRPPEQIQLGEILRALEGPLSLLPCVTDRRTCAKADTCAARQVWRELSGVIEETLDSITLEDVVGRTSRRSPTSPGKTAGHGAGSAAKASAHCGAIARGPRRDKRKTRMRARQTSRV